MQVPRAVTLQGDHVTLQPIALADADELFTALDHPAVWEHATHPAPRNGHDMRALIDEALNSRVTWTVRLAETNAIVGWTSYLDIDVANERLEIGSTAYGHPWWRSAVNSETKLLLLGHAFDTLGAGRVMLKTDIRNVRSQRAIERLGAKHEGILRRYQRRADGSMRDTTVYSILSDEWPPVKDGLLSALSRSAPSS